MQLFDLGLQLGHGRVGQVGFGRDLLLFLAAQLRQQGQLGDACRRVLFDQLRRQLFGNGDVVVGLALFHAHGGHGVGFQAIKAQRLVAAGVPHALDLAGQVQQAGSCRLGGRHDLIMQGQRRRFFRRPRRAYKGHLFGVIFHF